MLILTRKITESVYITVPNYTELIKVCILGVYGKQVRLGFNAPDDVAILREEIHSKILESTEIPQRHRGENLRDRLVEKRARNIN